MLVEALTGVNTDRLPEEQARGISIELGFAALELPSGRALSVVDVPGHERFVRTMVAGATGVDLFLLVIAADDGVMPQTREHLAILELLEVPAGVVSITKTDLAGADGVDPVVDQVRELLADGRYEQAPIVPVCAPAGEHLDELVAALDRVAPASPGRARAGGELRLHVDRSFSLRGIGTVVTGTLWSGVLQVGDEVRIEPSERTARVRSIEVHGNRRERADAGQRVAANLAGLDRREVERGDVLVTPGSSLKPAYIVDAAVELLPGARPLARGTRVHVHHATRSTAARLAPIESDVLEPDKRQYVQLRLERPVLPAAGDRLILQADRPSGHDRWRRGRRSVAAKARPRTGARRAARAARGRRRSDARRGAARAFAVGTEPGRSGARAAWRSCTHLIARSPSAATTGATSRRPSSTARAGACSLRSTSGPTGRR